MIVLCNQNLRNILFFNLHAESDVWNRPSFPGGSDGEESACSAGYPGLAPGSGRSLEKGMAAHSSIHAWRILWTEELEGYHPWGSPWGHKELDTVERLTLSPWNRNNILF